MRLSWLSDNLFRWNSPLRSTQRTAPQDAHPPQMTLSDLFTKYGTDKGRNGYVPVYEVLLGSRRDAIHNVLEFGIGTMDPDAAW